MHYKTCEICRIRSGRVVDQKRIFMAKFPLDEARCKQWVKVTGNEDLAYVPIEKLHELKHVCGKHFKPRDFKKKKTQLKRDAVPSLFLTAEPLADEILLDFPYHTLSSKNKQTADSKVNAVDVSRTNTQMIMKLSNENKINENLQLKKAITFNYLHIEPSTSNAVPIPTICSSNTAFDHDYCQSYVGMPETLSTPIVPIILEYDILDMNTGLQDMHAIDNEDHNADAGMPIEPSMIVKTMRDKSSYSSSPSTPLTVTSGIKCLEKKKSHNPIPSTSCASFQRNMSQAGIPYSQKAATKIVSTNAMTPRETILLNKLNIFKKKARILQRRLNQIEKISSPVLKSFIESAIKNQNRKSKGKRWSDVIKTVALTIYNSSPKTYSYLRKLLPLPSVRTLEKNLQKIKMEPGIDPTIKLEENGVLLEMPDIS